MNGVLIVAHGSRAKETEVTMEAVVDMVKAKLPQTIIEWAYMEFSDQDIQKGVEALVGQGVTQIMIVPYFLFMGIHIKEDIPRMVAACAKDHPDITITMKEPFNVDQRIADMLVDRIKE